jgi:hypothetical protein
MATTGLKFGIPDIELGCFSGMKINPSSFVGHELIALFCPIDPAGAAREIAAYTRHFGDFVDCDAWLLTFADQCSNAAVDGARRLLTIPDPDRRAWIAFRNVAHDPEELDRSSGAVFLFSRGGALHRYWHGDGHVDGVLAELHAPTFEHQHAISD